MTAVHEGLHEEDVTGLHDIQHCLELWRVERRRLLAQDVLARAGCSDSPLSMKMVRSGDVDGINVGVGEHLGVAAVGPFDAMGPGELRRSVAASRPHSHYVSLSGGCQTLGEPCGDVPGGYEPPAQTLHGILPEP